MKRTVIGIVAALASMAALTIAVIPLRDSRCARRRGRWNLSQPRAVGSRLP
jgi:hypothetical protein